MTMTEDEVRQKLGLKPFAEFAIERYQWLCSVKRVQELGPVAAWNALKQGRSTGQSTRLICTAIAMASSDKPVYITANKVVFENAQALAADAGIDPKLFRYAGVPSDKTMDTSGTEEIRFERGSS